ncbi:g9667 [Coccomyxa elongata]
MANTSAHCPSGHCSGGSDDIPCNPSQAAHEEEKEVGTLRDVHGGGAGTEGEGTTARAKLAAIKVLTHTLEAANLETAESRRRIVTALLMLCGQQQHA